MGRLVLMRHGESEGNRDRAFTLTPEVPLTDAGRAQARASAELIRTRWTPAGVVSSPFRRARDTAAIVADVFGLPVVVEDDLRERSYGELAGLPYSAALGCAGYDPAAYWHWCPPGGGETLVTVAARSGAVLDRLAAGWPDRELVVVSHGAVMRALWFHTTGSWEGATVPRNAGLVVVEHRAGRYTGVARVADGGSSA